MEQVAHSKSGKYVVTTCRRRGTIVAAPLQAVQLVIYHFHYLVIHFSIRFYRPSAWLRMQNAMLLWRIGVCTKLNIYTIEHEVDFFSIFGWFTRSVLRHVAVGYGMGWLVYYSLTSDVPHVSVFLIYQPVRVYIYDSCLLKRR